MKKRGRKKKYGRDYPNNPKKDALEKKIPFNRSIRRGVVIAFMETCKELGVEPSPMTEQLLLDFVRNVNK